MASKTLIGGTAYEISGGKTLVNGTAYSIKNGKTLVGGTAYEVGFANNEILDDWATIASGVNVSSYVLGNKKPFVLTNGTAVMMEIVAFNADTKTDGTTASITWISKGIVASHRMNATKDNENGWKASEMRTWLQSDFYAILPDEIKKVIVPVNKTYYDYTTRSVLSCVDNIWIPSRREICNDDEAETSGPKYTSYFTNDNSRIKRNSVGSADYWWLRSAVNTMSLNFHVIRPSGTLSGQGAAYSDGVVLGFCT